MHELPNLKLLDNDFFELYSLKKYSEEFIERFEESASKKRSNILTFFELNNFRKVRINLFSSKESYIDYVSQYTKPSSYSTGCCINGMINFVCVEEELQERVKAGFLIASIMHEFVHLLYHENINKDHLIWFEEGLAQYLSGQKSFLEKDEEKYKIWIVENVVKKEIPPIKFLKVHGGEYGKFCDCKTYRYNGYDISYAIVRFMIENYPKEEIIKMAKNIKYLQDNEENILYEFKNMIK